jgi:hypothetical protein
MQPGRKGVGHVMQNRSSYKPSQKSYTLDRPVQENPLHEAREAVLNALITNPKTPATELANIIVQNVDLVLLEALKDVLVLDFLKKTVRAERRKQTATDRAQLRLPGFELMPQTIQTEANGPRIELADAIYREVRAYCKLLGKRQTIQARNNAKLKQARALRDKMQQYAKNEPGITVRQVLLLEAG